MLAGHLNSSYVHYVCEIGLKLLPKPIYPGGSQARPMNILDYHSCIVQPTEKWNLRLNILLTQHTGHTSCLESLCMITC